MSVLGNEAAIRFGRRRLVATAMLLSITFAALLGLLGALSYARRRRPAAPLRRHRLARTSSSLTAGAAGTAEPARRGATLAVHSMLGYGGGFVGPLAVGWALDLAGGMSTIAWGLAFAAIAVPMAMALAVFLAIRPCEPAGDRRR